MKPLDRPSWLTAEPRITERIRSPSDSASESRLSTTSPHPSPRTKPFALASNALERPSGESAWSFVRSHVTHRERMTLTPPASARLLSPERRLWQARWTATSDEEHAVSTARLGPSSPRK
nr:hypothetical protein [Sorangium cellulosum]